MPSAAADPLKNLRNRILVTDVLSGLAKLPDESIDCVVTSPPYWGLRDYSIAPLIWDAAPDCEHNWQPVIANPRRDRRGPEEKKAGGSAVSASQQAINYTVKDFGQFCSRCRAWRGCLGLEPTIALYLSHLMQIFDELRRVLKPTGTMWINLGDCYGGGWGLKRRLSDADGENRVPTKSLSLLPHRFAIAMLARGWILRNHVVWYKPNHMPASVRDRLANSWDHVFFFVKAQRYFFDLDAIRVPDYRGRRDEHKNEPHGVADHRLADRGLRQSGGLEVERPIAHPGRAAVSASATRGTDSRVATTRPER